MNYLDLDSETLSYIFVVIVKFEIICFSVILGSNISTQLAALELGALEGNMESVTPSPREDDDEEVAHDLDLHQLILAGTQQEDAEPVKSAEEVIKEIDDIMQNFTVISNFLPIY
ncbi:hypothetical protein Avbf_00280 [Armadillidium vulgare]|nr:hypothetical protein Avbf_00280 [Armadillidium vulgare]